jgi:ribosomal protein S18 acetylase RimI-like enzyme
MSTSTLTIQPLTPERWPDLQAYFEGPAFADNPRWRSCYCQFLYVDHRKVIWAERSAEENRAQACERACNGGMQGYLAYREGAVVGWCNAAPRQLMDGFADEPDPNADRLGQITCFVVAKDQRRSGVATALLAAACAGLKAQGLKWAEACPKLDAADDASHHYGPLSLYEKAGFQVIRPSDHGYVIVRKAL